MTLIALTVFLVDKAFQWDWTWIKTPLDIPIFALFCLCIVSTIFSTHLYTSFWALMLFVNYIVIFYLTINTIRTRSQIRQLIYIIMGMGIFLSIFGLVKMGGINPFPWWEYPELTPELIGNTEQVRSNFGNSNRVCATFGNPDHLAGYMEMAIPVFLGFLLTGIKEDKRLIMGFTAFLMITALIFSLSRGGWIGLLTGISFMAVSLLANRYFKYKKAVKIMMVCLIIIAFIILSDTLVVKRIRTFEKGEDVAAARLTVWKATMDMIQAYPALGTGPGTFAFVFTQFHPPGLMGYYTTAHNDYLHFASELGLGFYGIAVWMMAVFYRRGFKKMNNPSRLVRGITLGGMSGITGILVHSFGDFNLHIPANIILFTTIAALIIAPLYKTGKVYFR